VHNFFPTFTPSIYDACIEAGLPVVQTLHNYRIFCASGLLARNSKPCELCLGGATLPAIVHACYQGSRTGSYALTRMIRYHRQQDTWNKKISAIIALSNFSAQKLMDGGICPEKIHVKPNFAFPPGLFDHDSEGEYALFVGRLSEEKGIRTLLSAWEKLKLPLWIVGDGPLLSEVEAAKSRNPHIKVLGSVPGAEVARIMAKAKFLVVPSECYENFPLVVAEAYSAGLPVLASRIGALAEIVKHEITGLHFEPGNADDLRKMATRLTQSPELIKRAQENAIASYLAEFAPESNLKRMLEIYGSVLEPRSGTEKSRAIPRIAPIRQRRLGLVHMPYRLVGGEESHVRVLSQLYPSLGFEPIFIPAWPATKPSLFAIAKSLTVGKPGDWDLLIKRYGIEFLHLHNIHPTPGPALLRWIIDRRIPTIMTVHNHRFYCTNGLALYGSEVCKVCRNDPSVARPIVKRCNGSVPKTIYHSLALAEIRGENLYQKAITHFIAPSPYVAEELVLAGLPSSRISVIPHPITLEESGDFSSSVAFDVAFVGRLSSEKGASQLLAAAALLPSRNFAIAGEGPLESELRKMATKNVKFLGKIPRSEALSLMRNAQVVCVPSICHESFSLVAAEAGALGSRLVVPNTESFKHFVGDPFHAVTADVKNAENLAQALEQAIGAPPRSSAEIESIRRHVSPSTYQARLGKLVAGLFPHA
jgi:glycosyltransferase involved in cell wall biosynthesis